MGKKTTIVIEHGSESSAKILDLMTAGDERSSAAKIGSFMRSLAGGVRKATVSIDSNSVAASGQLTVALPVADNTAVVNGVTFTAKVSPVGVAQFALGADDNATAANLVAKVNAHTSTSLKGVVKASVTQSGFAESATIAMVNDVGVRQIDHIVMPTTAAAVQGDYILVTETDGNKVALWLDIDANGTPPTGAAYVAADDQIPISIVTGGTAIDNAGIMAIALLGLATAVPTDNGDGTIDILNNVMGPTTIVSHNSGDLTAGSIVTSITKLGVLSALNDKYFTFKSANDVVSYYVWFNVNGEGVDPAQAGTPLQVLVGAGELKTVIATDVAAVIEALPTMHSVAVNEVVSITASSLGVSTDVSSGNSGLVVVTTQQGFDPIVEIVAEKPGKMGNSITLAATGGISASGSVLTNGASGTLKVLNLR